MKKWLIILMTIIVLVSGCSAGAQFSGSDGGVSENVAPSMDMPMDQSGRAESSEEAGTSDLGMREQKLIRQGYLEVTVEDARDYARQSQQKAEGFGGFVSNLSQYSNFIDGREYVNVSIQLRVPETRFDELVFWLEDTSDVTSKDISSTDVTEEYVDLEARIRNLKAQEGRLQEIAGEADTVEDLLAVERELSRVRGEIESLEGRFRYLQDRVQYSTLQLNIQEERTRPAVISGFSLGDIFRRAASAFTQGIYSFLNLTGELVVWISYALPFLLFILLVTFVIILLSKKAIGKRDRKE